MATKECIECKITKSVIDFHYRTDTGKYRNQCKVCRNSYVSKYKHERSTGLREKFKIVVTDGKKKCQKCGKLKPLSDYPSRNTEHGYRHKCWRCKLDYHNKYIVDRSNEELAFRLRRRQSTRISDSLRKYSDGFKCETTVKYIGCDGKHLADWLEYQFDDDMSWDNYPKYWTVDHVLPLSLFDLDDPEQQKIAFNWKNLQPLKDNFSKGNKIRVHQYMNLVVTIHRYIKLNNLKTEEYQWIDESRSWLREKLRYGE